MFLRLALICAMAAPASAACVDFQSFTKGVTVKLADGSVWSVHREAHDVIRAEQSNGTETYKRYVAGPFGVFQTESTRNGKGTVTEYHYVRTPPEPLPGLDWTSNVKATGTPIGASEGQRWREKVHATAVAAETLKIGSCAYVAVGVDLGHVGGPYPTVQHFTYFPDLRFGIQTRITYPTDTVKKSAIVSMKAD